MAPTQECKIQVKLNNPDEWTETKWKALTLSYLLLPTPPETCTRDGFRSKWGPKLADTRTATRKWWFTLSNILNWFKLISTDSPTFVIFRTLTSQVYSGPIKLGRTSHKQLAMTFAKILNSALSIVKRQKLPIPTSLFLFFCCNLMTSLVKHWDIFPFFNQWLNISANRGTNTGDSLKYTL